jgi:hypothetical protein
MRNDVIRIKHSLWHDGAFAALYTVLFVPAGFDRIFGLNLFGDEPCHNRGCWVFNLSDQHRWLAVGVGAFLLALWYSASISHLKRLFDREPKIIIDGESFVSRMPNAGAVIPLEDIVDISIIKEKYPNTEFPSKIEILHRLGSFRFRDDYLALRGKKLAEIIRKRSEGRREFLRGISFGKWQRNAS